NPPRRFVQIEVQIVVRPDRRGLRGFRSRGADHFQPPLVEVLGEVVDIIRTLDAEPDAVARFRVSNLGVEKTEAEPGRYARGLIGIGEKRELGRPKRIELGGNGRDSYDEQQQSSQEYGYPAAPLLCGALVRYPAGASHRIRYTLPERNSGRLGPGSMLCSATFPADWCGR